MLYFRSSLLRNQIQGETLPRLSQAGESFLPEFDFRAKIAQMAPTCLECQCLDAAIPGRFLSTSDLPSPLGYFYSKLKRITIGYTNH